MSVPHCRHTTSHAIHPPPTPPNAPPPPCSDQPLRISQGEHSGLFARAGPSLQSLRPQLPSNTDAMDDLPPSASAAASRGASAKRVSDVHAWGVTVTVSSK